MKPRKLTDEKRAAIERRRAWHPPEPTRVGSDLSLYATDGGGFRAVYIDSPEASDLVAYFDFGEDLSV